MTTNLTTNFGLPIPPLDSVGTTDNYSGLMTAADTAIFNASGKGAWVDYSATSTIVGWSSFTTKSIKYKKVGNLVFVMFTLAGDSDAGTGTAVQFTLPYANAGDDVGVSSGKAIDNSVAQADPAYITLGNGSAVVVVYKALNSNNWTNANVKSVRGQFFYEVA